MEAAKTIKAKSITNLGYETQRSKIEILNETLKNMSLEDRIANNVSPGRADIICAGLLCLTTLLREIGSEKIFITWWGLRQGILLNPSIKIESIR